MFSSKYSHDKQSSLPQRHLLSSGRNRSVVHIYVIAEKFSCFPRSESAMSPAPPAQRDKTSGATGTAKQSQAASGGKCTYEMERDRIGLWGSGDGTAGSRLSGLDRLRHPGLNKVTHIFKLIARSTTEYFQLGHG